MRRFLTVILAMSLLIFGQVTGEVSGAEAAQPSRSGLAADRPPQTFGTITGTVTFATAPLWDEQSADQGFSMALINTNGRRVETSLVPVTYSHIGSNGFSISYPNSGSYYNDYFSLANEFTVAFYPNDLVYPTTYLGGTSSYEAATKMLLPYQPAPSHTDVGNVNVALAPSISGTLTVPGGLPAGGVQAIAQSVEMGVYDRRNVTTVDVNADGSYHLFGLAADSYNVAFVPTGTIAGPGAGLWWKSKASLTGASAVTLVASQQRTGVNQTLPEGGIITGVLKDSQGHLVHGGGGVAIYSTAGTTDSRLTLVQQAFVEADGSYRFWGLPNGKYKLGFNTGYYPPQPSASYT